ncbi:MAG: hypothetical protein WBV80_16645 [Mycobacterium sp.]
MRRGKTIFDPFGTMGSSAEAGGFVTTPGDFDYGAASGDGLHAVTATGGNLLTDILSNLF